MLAVVRRQVRQTNPIVQFDTSGFAFAYWGLGESRIRYVKPA